MEDSEPTKNEADANPWSALEDSESIKWQVAEPVKGRLVLLAFVLLTLICFLVKGAHEPPPVRSADAEPELFSAERAAERLERLLGDESAHPLGTAANELVRKRLIAELTDLGLKPATSEHWASNEHLWSDEELRCDDPHHGRPPLAELAKARNVMATLPSTNHDLPAIILACHYDSVPAGPGAGDDGAAVAALLEVARALKPRFPLARPVILLFTDGEELGLFGAQAFSTKNPLATGSDRVGLVLNFEARGSSGASLMFETSEANQWIIEQVAEGLERPMSSSAYVEIYRLMPNGSDLTVFMANKMPGINFGFIRNPKHYHTSLDNLENLDLRSLQHHGDNALGMVTHLLEADWEGSTNQVGDAVYTDLFARRILSWKASSGPAFAASILVILLAVFVILHRRHRWPFWRIIGNLFCLITIIGLAAALSWGSAFLLRSMGATPGQMPDAMHFDVMVHCLFASFSILIAIFLFWSERTLFFLIHGIVMTVVGLVLAMSEVSGFSYLFILPGLASAVGGLLLPKKGASGLFFTVACLLPALVTAIIWVPFLIRVPYALGLGVAPAFGVIFVILLLPLVPLLVDFRVRALFMISLGLGASIWWSFDKAISTPPFTDQAPQQMNLTYIEEEDVPQAKLVIQALEGEAPDSLAEELTAIDEVPSTEFAGGHGGSAKPRAFAVESGKLSPPEFEMISHKEEADVHTARFSLRATGESQFLMVGIPATKGIELKKIKAAGIDLTVPGLDLDDYKWLRVRGAFLEKVQIELEWTGPAELPLKIAGINGGLPSHLGDLATRRDALPGCSAHKGDQSIAIKKVTLR